MPLIALHIISDLRTQSSLGGHMIPVLICKTRDTEVCWKGSQWALSTMAANLFLVFDHLAHLQFILTHTGARSPDTQLWWNVFPTGQSKMNGMKIWDHWALPPKEPSCQMTNIIDCNFLTFLCGDWVDRYSTFIIPYPGTLETCFRRKKGQVVYTTSFSTFLFNVYLFLSIWVFPKIGVPQNGWFMLENPIKMDDLGVPLFSETSIYHSVQCVRPLPRTDGLGLSDVDASRRMLWVSIQFESMLLSHR